MTEKLGVEDQERVGLQERFRKRLGVAGLRDVLLYLVYGKEAHPLLALDVSGGDLLVQLLRHTVQSDTVAGVDDELLLLEEYLLKVFDLGEERDHVSPDPLYGPHHLEPAVGALRPPRLQVVHVEDLVLEVEIEFPLQETLEALVDEEVRGVA